MHQMVLTIYYFFWVRYHPSRVYSQKKSRLKTKYRPHFPPTTKPYPLNPLDREPNSLVLVGYRLVLLRPFRAYSTIFCFCHLSFPCYFCYSRLVLFHSAACFCRIFSCVSCCVCHFLWFGFSFLHAVPAADTSYCSLFLFIVLLHISFHAYLFIQKDLGFCGSNNVKWIKRALSLICLYLPKSFCQRTVLYGKAIFCCRSLSLVFISLDLSCSLIFLVGLWALLFIELSSVWAFGYGFTKNGHKQTCILKRRVSDKNCYLVKSIKHNFTHKRLGIWVLLMRVVPN